MRMKKYLTTLLLGLIFIGGVSSCNSVNNNAPDPVEEGVLRLSENGNSMSIVLYPGETRTIDVDSPGVSDIVGKGNNAHWKVLYNKKEGAVSITAPIDVTIGEGKILVSGVDKAGRTLKGTIHASLHDYSNPYGAFVLNEGNAWGTPPGMGSLIYISPVNTAIPNIYFNLNGKKLGHATQDMFESHGKYYIIAQNHHSETDGMLTIVDAKTLKKIKNKTWGNKELNWPTHVAVLDDSHIYLRDNEGIWRYDSAADKLTFVEGSKGARKNVMIVLHGKVIASNENQLQIISAERDKVEKSVEFPANISGLAHSGDGHFYASYLNGDEAGIVKIDGKTYKSLKENKITDESAPLLDASYAASSSISAKGDTIYYSGTESTIYRHIFSTNTSKLMVDTKLALNPEHQITYNTAQVHPLTGHVYFNTLKYLGADFLDNTIYRFDMTGDEAKLVERFDDITRFPAGIFFPTPKQ